MSTMRYVLIFKLKKDLDKETHFHPSYLIYMLALFINRAKAADQLSGVVPHLIDDELYPYYNTLMIPLYVLKMIWK